MLRHRSSTYVGIALFPLAVVGVHRMRYLLAYGDSATAELQAQGHAYLGALGPVLIVLLAAATGAFLGKLAEHWQGGETERAVRARRIWLTAALALIAVYTAQETLEGFFATGHPGGITGVFGNGGLWAIPGAVLLAGVLALAMRGGHRAARAVAAAGVAARIRIARPSAVETPVAVLISRLLVATSAPLARLAAGRGPPALSPPC